MPTTPLPTLGKPFPEPRRPLVGAFRPSSRVCPPQAGFSFLREMVLQKWSGCLAGHRGELFQAKFGNEGELENNIAPKSHRGVNIAPASQMGQHSPNIAPRWANIGLFRGHFCNVGRSKVLETKCFAGIVMRPCRPQGRAFLEPILNPKTIQMGS